MGIVNVHLPCYYRMQLFRSRKLFRRPRPCLVGKLQKMKIPMVVARFVGFVLTCEKICFLLLLGLQDRDSTFRRGVFDPTPFPPGVGGGRSAEADSQSFEVITADRAIDESNVGNRMLRNMGWQEGLGLGKDGSGMIEPVQAQSTGRRAGLGSQSKKVDPALEAQSGDSYKTLIQKKAIARFREMS